MKKVYTVLLAANLLIILLILWTLFRANDYALLLTIGIMPNVLLLCSPIIFGLPLFGVVHGAYTKNYRYLELGLLLMLPIWFLAAMFVVSSVRF